MLVLATMTALASSACPNEPAPVVIDRVIASPVPTAKPSTEPKRSVRKVAASPSAVIEEPSGRTPRSKLESLVRRVFGAAGDAAVKVAHCETGGTWDPAVVNSSGHTGLFQISPRWHSWRAKALGYSWADMRTAEPNVRVAYHLFLEQGWGPWTCRSAI